MNKLILPVIALFSIGALSASAYPPPEKDEVTVGEMESSLFDLNGKVVKVEVTRASGMRPMSSGKYRAYCSYRNNVTEEYAGREIFFDEEGKKFFEGLLHKSRSAGADSFYALIEDGKVIPIGERYKKSKGIYSW